MSPMVETKLALVGGSGSTVAKLCNINLLPRCDEQDAKEMANYEKENSPNLSILHFPIIPTTSCTVYNCTYRVFQKER